MILDSLGLTDAEKSELLGVMTTSGDYTLHVELRDRNEQPIDEISSYVVGGQVDLDLTTPWDPNSVGRRLTLVTEDYAQQVGGGDSVDHAVMRL